ncbi:MAG: surface-adhesin E family protein [Dialister invisus]
MFTTTTGQNSYDSKGDYHEKITDFRSTRPDSHRRRHDSYAVNWVYLGQDGNDRIYYDTASISRQGNLVAVTMQEREADGEAEEYNYLFDTHRKKYTLASKIEYDRNGNVKKIETFHESDFGWKKVKENSEEELLYKQIVNKPATASL